LASALGEELAQRGHDVHFISYERPFRLPVHAPRLFFHPVGINEYGLFKYPDYTLPLSVKMAEVSRTCKLDVLHVHYAVPHATAAILSKSMLPPNLQPRVVTTLHGTDTTLFGRDGGYGPAILHALNHSDAVTAVSDFLRKETERSLGFSKPIDVIHNFFTPRPAKRPAKEIRQELGVDNELVVLHSSNLRQPKRIDLLLETVARVPSEVKFKLVILAGDSFAPFAADLRLLNLEDRVLVLEKVKDIEDYLQIADLSLYTSEVESFCLSILEGMCFACPAVASRVGGIPEVVEDGVNGVLVPFGEVDNMARALTELLENAERRKELGRAAQERAHEHFSAEAIVPVYEALYRRVCEK
jgi:N-acetyl-alpha-D-glucosaminyl L-malate synthase BshA